MNEDWVIPKMKTQKDAKGEKFSYFHKQSKVEVKQAITSLYIGGY